MPPRLGVLDFHPIQYHVPLYRRLAERGQVRLDVLDLRDLGYRPAMNDEFGVVLEWNIDLLSGYPSNFLTSADQSGAVPFLDIGDRYVLAGAQYDPQVLAGLSAAQIAAQLRNPSSPVAQAIDGSAKVIVAAINQVLHDQAGQG